MTVAEREAPKAVVLSASVGNVRTLRAVIREHWKPISAVLPAHFTEERFGGLVISAASKDDKIFKCTGISILNAIYQAASIGLEINSATGEAYLIPYGQNAQLVPGYKGLVKLAIQSREVVAIEARLVYDGEVEFAVHYGTDSRIEHKPNFDIVRNPDAVTHAYAVAKLPSGGTTFEVMTRKQLDAIWQRSAGKDRGPWKTDREEMYRKTVTRRLCKYLPMSPQLAQAVELSDKAETGEFDTTTAPSEGAQALNAAVGATAKIADCEACGGKDGQHTDGCPYNEQGA